MNGKSTFHQVKYILWIRSEYKPQSSPVFRGTLETISGQQFEFTTLVELIGLLCEMGGWIDTSRSTNEYGDPSLTSPAESI